MDGGVDNDDRLGTIAVDLKAGAEMGVRCSAAYLGFDQEVLVTQQGEVAVVVLERELFRHQLLHLLPLVVDTVVTQAVVGGAGAPAPGRAAGGRARADGRRPAGQQEARSTPAPHQRERLQQSTVSKERQMRP